MNILITICGRQGSKGVKNKNIRKLNGIPLIYYTYAAAKLFLINNPNYKIDIVINSDGDDILETCKKLENCTLIKRPKELATDTAAKLPTIIYSLKYMEDYKKNKYDYVIDLDITSPLRKAEDIFNVLEIAKNKNMEVVFSVVPSRRNPYFNMVERSGNGTINLCKKSNFTCRQDAPQVFDMNASIYCYLRNSLINNPQSSPLKYNVDIYEMPETVVIDIDTEKDFEMLSILYNYYFNGDYNELIKYIIRNKIL